MQGLGIIISSWEDLVGPTAVLGNKKKLAKVGLNDVAFWQNNVFYFPCHKSRKQYIEEITQLINSWIHDLLLKMWHSKGSKFASPETIRGLKIRNHLEVLKRRLDLRREKKTDIVAHRG